MSHYRLCINELQIVVPGFITIYDVRLESNNAPAHLGLARSALDVLGFFLLPKYQAFLVTSYCNSHPAHFATFRVEEHLEIIKGRVLASVTPFEVFLLLMVEPCDCTIVENKSKLGGVLTAGDADDVPVEGEILKTARV